MKFYCCGSLRLSIYTFNDLTNSYVIIQFEGKEINELLNKLLKGNVDELKNEVEGILNCKVKSLSLASGEMIYEGTKLPMAYLRIELDNSEQYSLEVYSESATVITNMNLSETYSRVIKLMRAFIPGVRIPKSRVLAF